MDTKTPGKKNTGADWKQKALDRGKQFKKQNKRIREIKYSRDHWKEKYLKMKKEKNQLLTEITKIKKKLNEIIN